MEPIGTHQSDTSRSRISVGVALIAVLALLAATVGWAALQAADQGELVAADAGGDEPAEEPDAGDETGDPDTDTVGPVPTGNDELDATIAELMAFVADARGLEFTDPVEVQIAPDAEFEDRLARDFEDEDAEDIEEYGRVLVALGIIERDDDIESTMLSLLEQTVLGFYDPETDELVVRGDELSPMTRTTVVHELVHALDDQHFELHRPELEDATDESQFGFSAVVEGNARWIEDEYRASLDDDERDAVRREELALGARIDPTAFPIKLYEILLIPYEYGDAFIAALLAEEGRSAVDAAFEDPPSTAEQVIDPGLYLEGEEPLEVAQPPAEGEVFDDGVFGELDLIILLEEIGSRSEAEDLAATWEGGAYVAWGAADGTSCLRGDVAVADEAGGADLVEALEEWSDEVDVDAVVATEGDLVRLTSCA